MADIRGGKFISDGGDVYIPVGFIPDYVRVTKLGGDTAVEFFEWLRYSEANESAGKQDGISVKEGVTAEMNENLGIAAYDSSGEAPTITPWTQAVGSAASARTNTADGTFVKPVADRGSNPPDRELMFECITAGTSGATEPTWNRGIGETTLDGTTLWECVREPRRRYGYKGFFFDETEQTDSDIFYYVAMKFDEFVDHGDVDGWTNGIENS